METAPTIKSGPDVEQKETSLWASNLEISLFCLSSEASFAPTGYPDTVDIAKTKELLPDTLKSFFVTGLIINPKTSTNLSLTIKLAAIINGNKDGIKVFTHIENPFLAAKIESLGNKIIPIISSITIKDGVKNFKNFIFFKISPTLLYSLISILKVIMNYDKIHWLLVVKLLKHFI